MKILEKNPIFQYDNNINVSLLSALIPIKYLPEGKNYSVHSLLLVLGKVNVLINEFFCTLLCKWGFSIKGIYFDQSYSPVAHVDSFRIKIDIVAMHRLTSRILDVGNAFQNINVSIHERVCVSPPLYYIDWVKISYPNVPLNRDYGTFFLQCMNVIQGTKPTE